MTCRTWNVYRGMNFGNGLRLTAGYSSQRQQMTSFVVDTQSGSSVLWRQHYDYYESGKNNGRIRRLSDQANFSTYNKYHYDTYNRLTLVQMHPSLAWHAAYSHDEWGNIRTINSVASGGAALNYQTNSTGAPTNRLSTAGAYSFSYDAAGNMTAGNGTTFSYDAASRLKGVGGVSNQYGYDGDGKRVRQPGLYSVWSSVLDKVAFEVDVNANVQRAFVYLGGEVIALQSTDGNFYWVHSDHLSSGRMLTNTAGAVVYRGDFDPFGQVAYEWSASGNVNLNTRKFTGYERDATGLDYARARTYTSSWGRFVQADPLGSGYQGQRPNPMGAAKNDRPQTLNRYSYVSNDPTNFDDPSGLLRRSPDDGCVCCGSDPTGGGGDGGSSPSSPPKITVLFTLVSTDVERFTGRTLCYYRACSPNRCYSALVDVLPRGSKCDWGKEVDYEIRPFLYFFTRCVVTREWGLLYFPC
jgi:RHS repeat-associated protein